MELLERAAASRELDAGLAGLASRGGVVLLAGEAGIGKSALVKEFRERWSAAAGFLVGACDPLLTPRALGPVHDIAREAGGALSESLASGGREAIFAALLGHLAPAAQPRVVVVEDAHWADEATLDLLLFLGRRIEHLPALLVVTYRDDELGAGHPLLAVIGRLPAEVVRRVRLEPLSEAAVAELARRAGRSGTGLRALTGGNPLLLAEVLAAPDSEVPHTVRDLALARLAGLPPPAREAVRLVSVVPHQVEPWLWEEVARLATPAVEAVMSSGLLAMDAERIGFRHELLRRAVEGSLPVPERRRLNRQVLEALTATGEPVDVARLVHHAREAGDVDAVLRHAPEAARQAAALAAHREAVAHYRAALTHADRLPAPARAEVLEGYSVEAYLSGLADVAVAARRSAVTLREAAGDRERVGEGLRWLSRLHWWAGERRDAEAAATRAIAELRTLLPPGRQLALAYSNQSQLDMLAGRWEPSLRWAGQALTLARELDDAEATAHALTNIGSARLQANEPGGRAELEEAFRMAAAAGLADHAARAIGNLATIGAEVRRHEHVREDLDRALAFVRQHELAGWVQHLLGHRARVRLDLGDWAGAERDARAALAEDVSGGGRIVDALVPLALVQARRGDPAAADTLQEATERAFATGELQWIGPVAAARAEHAWLGGDDGRAVEEVAAVYPKAEQARHPWFAGELALWSRLAGGPPLAPASMAAPHRLLLAGDWSAAAEAWHGLGWPYHRALALLSGDDEARLRALTLMDGLGARQAALRLRRELRRAGTTRIPAGPTRATAANPAGLSNRQVEVLRLLAEGLTDAEIAARLFLSTKTVGHHVSALLGKLGAGSRHQAAAAARGLGVLPAERGEGGSGT